jgi:heterodisulfide reductase subunit A
LRELPTREVVVKLSEKGQKPECSDYEAKKSFYPPCREACPANVNVQAYVSLISNGRFGEALEVIRKDNPFPAVCGRVCFALCEEECARKNIDAPVGIRLLKRLVSDLEFESERIACAERIPPSREEKVAVIGSGPAGLTAAYFIVKMGYPVTVFEKDPKPGGMLRYCLPMYRLPEDVLDAEIKYIVDTGVEVRTNINVGEDISLEGLLNGGYRAVFIAAGAPRSRAMNIEGEGLVGVTKALDFLKEVHTGKIEGLSGRVVVVGGGDAAIDSARTAIRLGPDQVTVMYRRRKEDMPARPEEVEEAESEGVKFVFLANPIRVLGNEAIEAVECTRMRLGEPDSSGRRRPVPIPGSEFAVPADLLVEAVGEITNLSFITEGIKVTRRETVEVDPITFETSMPGIFAGGDVVTGPKSVIDAIAAGKTAARAIDLYLKGEGLDVLRAEEIEKTTWVKEGLALERKPWQESGRLPLERRWGNFEEVELGFTWNQGIREALRCLHCGPCAECLEDEGLCEHDTPVVDGETCSGCGTCISICPFDAMSKDEEGITQVDEALCKGCGLCAASCPERAITMTAYTNEVLMEAITA